MTRSVLPLLPVLLGLAALWVGTAVALRGASRMSGRDTAWEVVVGLTVLGVGTALPEVGVTAAALASATPMGPLSGLIIGTVLGSVLARATLVLGLARLTGTAEARAAPHETRAPVLVTTIAAVWVLSSDGSLGRLDGALLLAAWAALQTMRTRGGVNRVRGTASGTPLLPDAFLVALGGVILAGAAWWIVPDVLALADVWAVSPLVIGLLLLGTGTSLPELIFALSAATRGRVALSPASVLATGTVGLLLPLGLAGLVSPLHVEVLTLRVDLPALAIPAVVLWAWERRATTLTSRRALLLVLYFLAFALLRMLLG